MSKSSRELASTWPYPRHKAFVKRLRDASAAWFQEKGYSTHHKMPYCLDHWDNWKNNIILTEVAEYIDCYQQKCESNNKPFPLHKYVHHGLSSQAMAFNLIGPLIVREDLMPLKEALEEEGVDWPKNASEAVFEYEDREVFNEDVGQPTSIDAVIKGSDGCPRIFIESKLVEQEFGGCSVFSSGDCDGSNPISNNSECYLKHIGRKYFELMKEFGFDTLLANQHQCVFASYYQFFREVLFSIKKNGVFVLLSDSRSPVFDVSANGQKRGLMTFLKRFVPAEHQNKIASITVQSLINKIKCTSNHEWAQDFEKKYGL